MAAVHAAALALGGCTTTYTGQKIGPDGALAKAGGVPFVMTKPEYTLNITADPTDATKPVHTLTVAYVPDATQRFTLALDPALLVNGKLELDFGSSGNLTGAAATTTTRVVETFGALVQLAIKAKSTSLLDSASTLDAYKTRVKETAQCTTLQATLKGLEEEAKREVGDRTNVERARADWVGERLHYLDQAQRECMIAVVKNIEDVQEKPAKNRYDDALEEAKKAADGNAELLLLNRQIQAEFAALNEDALKKIDADLTGKGDAYKKAQEAARQGAQYVQLRLAGRFARSLADMGSDVWRARHLAYLERKLAQCRIDSLLPNTQSVCNEKKEIAGSTAALRDEWTKTLGETATVERIARIDTLLAAVRKSPPNALGRHGAVDEHVKLREERDKLQTRLDQLRTDLIGKNKIVALGPDAPKATKVDPRPNVPVTLVKRGYVDAVKANPASFKNAKLPEFVLVLEPDDSGAVAPLPTPTTAGAKQ